MPTSSNAVGRPFGPVGGRGTRALAGLLLLLAAVGLSAAPPVGAEAFPQETLVEGLPTNTTPHMTNGEVRSVTVAGDTVILGGKFTTNTDPDRTTVVNQRYLVAFNRHTGIIDRNFRPVLDNEVFKVIAAPDGQSVYVGGRFGRVNGVTSQRVARIRLSDGARLPFASGVDALVTEMALQNGRLIVGGVFHNVQGRNRRVAALDAETGVVDDSFAVAFAGTHRGFGEGRIWGIEAAPDGQSVVVIGSFATVGGLARNQAVKLHTGGPGPVTVSDWTAPTYANACGDFDFYASDVAFSPDSSYFVIVSTGGKGSGIGGQCDAVARWTNDDVAGSTPVWTEYSGADSYYSVEVTDAAVYVGGHFRWSNNSFGSDSAGAGAVPTAGIAALDPTNGLPLSWNPGRDRGRAVWEMQATQHGLYVASDTDRIAGGLYRGRIAFFSLGTRTVPQPPRPHLPITVEQYTAASGVTSNSYDGTSFGPTSTIVPSAGATSLSGSRAAFLADGNLYTARSNSTFVVQSFDGTTLGAPTTIDLHGLSAFESDLRNMRGMVYDDGRIYFTRADSGSLFMRYFSTESNIVGAERFTLAGTGYSAVANMWLAGNDVYYVNRTQGQLNRASFSPTGFGPSTPIGPTGAWSTSALIWARPALGANQPPTVSATGSCHGMSCSFTATATDPDGTVSGIAWDFGDGATATGAAVSHTFATAGPRTVTVTVTDDRGATGSATVDVTAGQMAPTASFTVSCNGATCGVDASDSFDPDGSIVSWAWTFGDGGTGSGESTAHTYTASGTYTIELTVTDDAGNSDTETAEAAATVGGASAAFVASAARTVGNTANSHSVTVPTAVQAGDTMLLFATSNAGPTTALDAPVGWTRLRDANTSGSRSALFSKVATAADAGSSVAVTLGAFARADVVLAAYRDVTVSSHAGTTGYTTPTASAATGDWVVSYWGDKSSTTSGWSAPAGQSVRHAWANTGSGHVSELLADSGGAVPGGAHGGLAAIPTGGPIANAVAMTVILRPSA